MSTDTGRAGDQQALGATRAAEIAIGDGDYGTAEQALLQALGQVRKRQTETQETHE